LPEGFLVQGVIGHGVAQVAQIAVDAALHEGGAPSVVFKQAARDPSSLQPDQGQCGGCRP